MEALRSLVNNSFKENFYEKKINILTIFFFIFHKSDVKIFLKLMCLLITKNYTVQ